MGSVKLAVLAALLVSATAPAAQESGAAALIEKAILAEESERDFERALELYAEVGDDPDAPAAVRARAWLRAGQCLQRLGRTDEAKRALEQAAGFDGTEAAAAALALLSGGAEAADMLAWRIEQALLDLSGLCKTLDSAAPNFASVQSISDLIWIGRPALPRLLQVLESRGSDLSLISGVAYVVISIGGEEAAAELRAAISTPDPLYQRAVLAAVTGSGIRAEPVRTALLTFLDDRDERLRQLALSRLDYVMTIEELARMTRDESAEIRARALNEMVRSEEKRPAPPDGFADPVLDAIERAVGDVDLVKDSACEALGSRRMLWNERGRRIYLGCLTHADLTTDKREGWLRKAGEWSADEPIPVEDLLDVARRLAPFPAARAPSRGKTRVELALEGLIERSAQCAVRLKPLDPWAGAGHSTAWELFRITGESNLVYYALESGTSEDVVTLAGVASEIGLGGRVLPLIAQKAHELDIPQKTQVLQALERRLADERELLGKSNPQERQQLGDETSDLLRTITALGFEAGDRRLVKFVRAEPAFFQFVTNELLGRAGPPASAPVLAELLVTPGADRAAQPTDRPAPGVAPGQDPQFRGRIFDRLLADAPSSVLPILDQAYAIGVGEERRDTRGRPYRKGIRQLLVDDGVPQPGQAPSRTSGSPRWAPRFPASQLAPVFEACARGQSIDFWWDVDGLFDYIDASAPDGVATELSNSIGRHAIDCPDQGVRSQIVGHWVGLGLPGSRQFALEHLGDPELGARIVGSIVTTDPAIVQRVLDLLPGSSRQFATEAIRLLEASGDPRAQDAVIGLFADPHYSTRKRAVAGAFEHFGERALEASLPLAHDESPAVRIVLFEKLATSFDRRALPVLVEGLRDPDAGARDAARKSLESLQFYFEQKERWTRLLEGAGFDSGSAAEALIEQADAKQPKPTRLAAIESLGTLGVPESLPFLIRFLAEKDPDIAAAAQAAVDRINRRAAEPKAREGGE